MPRPLQHLLGSVPGRNIYNITTTINNNNNKMIRIQGSEVIALKKLLTLYIKYIQRFNMHFKCT